GKRAEARGPWRGRGGLRKKPPCRLYRQKRKSLGGHGMSVLVPEADIGGYLAGAVAFYELTPSRIGTSDAISGSTKSGRGTEECSATPRRLIQTIARPRGFPPTISVNCDCPA